MNKIQKKMANDEATSNQVTEYDSQKHRIYETPSLIIYGDVRDVTLGPTPGIGESGCEFARRAGSPLGCP